MSAPPNDQEYSEEIKQLIPLLDDCYSTCTCASCRFLRLLAKRPDLMLETAKSSANAILALAVTHGKSAMQTLLAKL